MVRKRQRWLTVFLLIFAVGNWVRGGLFLAYMPTLAAWELALPSQVLGAIYLGLGCGLAAVALVYHARRDQRIALGGGAAYQATVWTLNLVGYRSTYARELWARDLVLSLLFLGAIAVLGWAPSRKPRETSHP